MNTPADFKFSSDPTQRLAQLRAVAKGYDPTPQTLEEFRRNRSQPFTKNTNLFIPRPSSASSSEEKKTATSSTPPGN